MVYIPTIVTRFVSWARSIYVKFPVFRFLLAHLVASEQRKGSAKEEKKRKRKEKATCEYHSIFGGDWVTGQLPRSKGVGAHSPPTITTIRGARSYRHLHHHHCHHHRYYLYRHNYHVERSVLRPEAFAAEFAVPSWILSYCAPHVSAAAEGNTKECAAPNITMLPSFLTTSFF